MNIIAQPDFTGAAPADSAWQAYDDDTFDGPGSLVGWGPTREAAIADLQEKMGILSDEPGSDCAHEWSYTGSAYGGDDPRWFGEGRCFCIHCGADGDG